MGRPRLYEQQRVCAIDHRPISAVVGDELLDRYHRQLELYALALSQTLERPVRECLLYSFALGKAFDVPIPE